MEQRNSSTGEPSQLPRFGHLRQAPPVDVLALLDGAAPGTDWTTTRMGGDGGYSNGGIWRMEADRKRAGGRASVVVKRTGAAHLGSFQAWAHRTEPSDPQWWGREAEFYLSDLATTGWTQDVRAARCYVDDHDGCRDLWLEDVSGIPARLAVCRRAVAGLAHWQVSHAHSAHPWVSTDWIASHVARHAPDNKRTQNHPSWPSAIERGLNPALRDWAATRVTSTTEITRRLAGFPRVLTNHDFHEHNIGTVDAQVVLIDWAYAGWGPIGHDAGHLALSVAEDGQVDLAMAWQVLEDAYCEGLVAAGWSGDLAEVRRSARISNQLRMSWWIDHLLDHVHQLPDVVLTAASRNLSSLYQLS
jgi:hypothetical protein